MTDDDNLDGYTGMLFDLGLFALVVTVAVALFAFIVELMS